MNDRETIAAAHLDIALETRSWVAVRAALDTLTGTLPDSFDATPGLPGNDEPNERHNYNA